MARWATAGGDRPSPERPLTDRGATGGGGAGWLGAAPLPTLKLSKPAASKVSISTVRSVSIGMAGARPDGGANRDEPPEPPALIVAVRGYQAGAKIGERGMR